MCRKRLREAAAAGEEEEGGGTLEERAGSFKDKWERVEDARGDESRGGERGFMRRRESERIGQ